MTKIWVTGEALIDFVPNETPAGTGFVPYCGGSTYNVARAAALQGADVSFVGALSRDMFGDQLAAALIADGVDLGGTPRVDHPTTLAFVKFDGNDARYAFFNTGSATQMTDHSATVLNAEPGDILHAGSISLIDEPGGANITDFVCAQSDRLLLSLDPNARPGMITDLAGWQARIDRLVDHAGIVKLSDEDLEVLAPGTDPQDYIRGLVDRGVALAVITMGGDGAFAATRSGTVRAASQSAGLVDTVGAGDTVMGTLLTQVIEKDLTQAETLASLGTDALETLLGRAMTAAWLNCKTTGCNPPTRQAIDAVIAG